MQIVAIELYQEVGAVVMEFSVVLLGGLVNISSS